MLAERLGRREEADPMLATALRESDEALGEGSPSSVALLEALGAA